MLGTDVAEACGVDVAATAVAVGVRVTVGATVAVAVLTLVDVAGTAVAVARGGVAVGVRTATVGVAVLVAIEVCPLNEVDVARGVALPLTAVGDEGRGTVGNPLPEDGTSKFGWENGAFPVGGSIMIVCSDLDGSGVGLESTAGVVAGEGVRRAAWVGDGVAVEEASAWVPSGWAPRAIARETRIASNTRNAEQVNAVATSRCQGRPTPNHLRNDGRPLLGEADIPRTPTAIGSDVRSMPIGPGPEEATQPRSNHLLG